MKRMMVLMLLIGVYAGFACSSVIAEELEMAYDAGVFSSYVSTTDGIFYDGAVFQHSLSVEDPDSGFYGMIWQSESFKFSENSGREVDGTFGHYKSLGPVVVATEVNYFNTGDIMSTSGDYGKLVGKIDFSKNLLYFHFEAGRLFLVGDTAKGYDTYEMEVNKEILGVRCVVGLGGNDQTYNQYLRLSAVSDSRFSVNFQQGMGGDDSQSVLWLGKSFSVPF